ncbi:HigA family addiction module antitoxin [Paraburkholderia unamae]
MAIQNFHDKETALIWSGAQSRRLPVEIQQVARRKLRMLNAALALALADLRVPPANRLEALTGIARTNTVSVSTTSGGYVSNGTAATPMTSKSSTTTEVRTMKKLRNVHPGEVLQEEFLTPMEMSQNALARAMKVPPRRINEIVHGARSVTADTALRLSIVFGTSPQFWMNLQSDYDLEEAAGNADLSELRPLAA